MPPPRSHRIVCPLLSSSALSKPPQKISHYCTPHNIKHRVLPQGRHELAHCIMPKRSQVSISTTGNGTNEPPAGGSSASTPARNATPVGRTSTQPPDPNQASASAAPQIPEQRAHHGAPVRDYLNTKVTSVLLDGMKMLAITM